MHIHARISRTWQAACALGASSLLAAALLAVPAPALARSHHRSRHHHHVSMVPKGTPYAAEVIATITGTAHIDSQQTDTFFNTCETLSSVDDQHGAYDLKWRARYPQVTVPVAGPAQLGHALTRLHVRAQPTSNGTGGLEQGTYDIQGDSPPTTGTGGNSDCGKQHYSASGHLFAPTHPVFSDLTLALLGDEHAGTTQVFVFNLGTILSAGPASFPVPPEGSDPENPEADFNSTAGLVPLKTYRVIGVNHPSYNEVPADFKPGTLRKLVHSREVHIPVSWSGSHDCGNAGDDFGKVDCKATWSYKFNVKLTRRFLYRTRHAYRK